MADDKPFDMVRATYWLDAMSVEQSYAPLERLDVIGCDLVTDMAAEIVRLRADWEILAAAVLLVMDYRRDGKGFSPDRQLRLIRSVCENFHPPAKETDRD